jgi:xylulose-5-phosphate/fructose-6-phosphate phosphoketolase
MDRDDHTEAGAQPLSPVQFELMDAWWRAANYLSVGQIYLLDNPLLQRPLEPADIKPRLLGHWGTTPASTSFMYTSIA